MATISNTPRPGYAWDATDNVWYPIGVGQHSHGEIPATIVDAKGDIVTATADNTPARLAVGSNGDTLVADSSTSTGLRYQGNFAAGKNKIINGDFYFNQRGFTSNTTDNTYNFDRWVQENSGGTVTVTPQTFTPGTAPVAGYEGKNFVRVVTASQSAAGHYALYEQRIEDVRTFAGQTITVSFWAKAASGTPNVGLTVTQSFGGGGSSTVNTSAAAVKTITTSWARYSFNITVPSISGKTIGTVVNNMLVVSIVVSTGSTLVALGYANTGIQNNTFDIWGVQAESGSTATAFQTATGTIQGELAAAQRYYQVLASGASGAISNAFVYSANGIQGIRPLCVEMRTTPTLSIVTGTNYYSFVIGSTTSFNSLILDGSTTNKIAAIYINTLSGLTTGQAGQFNVANASAFIAVQAEL
jgi:hypothetical protein